MTQFEKKINKFNRLRNSGFDYIYGLKNPRLSGGFWNKYGYKLEDILNDFNENYTELWNEYCIKNNICADVGVDDLMC